MPLTTFRRRRWRLPALTREDAVPIGLLVAIGVVGLVDLAHTMGWLCPTQ